MLVSFTKKYSYCTRTKNILTPLSEFLHKMHKQKFHVFLTHLDFCEVCNMYNTYIVIVLKILVLRITNNPELFLFVRIT